MDQPLVTPPRVVVHEWLRALRNDRVRLATVIMTAVSLAVIGYFALQPRGRSASPPGAVAASSQRQASTPTSPDARSTTVSSATVVVHVAGAVVRPGVVSLPIGSRVVDAVDAAGGTLALADPNQLDLAAKLVDGTRIYVPLLGERVAPSTGNGATGSTDGQPGNGALSGTPINLNTATQAELEALPGVGPSLAQGILAERERLGGFSSVDDLKRVRGIGDRRFEQLKPLVSI